MLYKLTARQDHNYKEDAMAEIIKIDDTTYRIEEANVRYFLLIGTKKALLIDSGMESDEARYIAESITKLPLELINTHSDPDHIGGNDKFDWFYMHPSEAIVYYNIFHRKGVIRPVYEGDIIDLGNRKLEIILIPGHTPGSIGIIDSQTKALISGDSIQDGRIFMFNIHREMNSYILGLENVLKHSDKYNQIYPSHSTFPVSKDLVPLLIQDAKDILSNKLTPTVEEVHGNKVLAYKTDNATFLRDYKENDQ